LQPSLTHKGQMSSHESQLHRPVKSPLSGAPAPLRDPWSRGEKVFVLLASVLFLALCLGSIRTEAVTTNETVHIPAGLSYWQQFDARMNIQHPPLVKLLAALPLLLVHAKADYSDATWNVVSPGVTAEDNFGEKSFESWSNRGEILFLARLPMIALTLLLGLSIYEMTRQVAGTWGGALALTLFVTSPFFLSYGTLVLTDVPVVLFVIWTMWYFASLWQEPTRRNALMFSLSLAGALLTKFNGVFLFPALLLCWMWFRFSEKGAHLFGSWGSLLSTKKFRREGLAIGGVVLAGLIVYVFYLGIFHRTDPLSATRNEQITLAHDSCPIYLLPRLITIMSNHPALQRPLQPLWLYVDGLVFVKGYESRAFYFLGRLFPHGVWFYFPVISFFKLAPGMILLFFLLMALVVADVLRNRNKAVKPSIVSVSRQRHLQALLSALVVFAAIPMASKLNVGVRHFSVPIALGIILSGLIVPLTRAVVGERMRPVASVVVAALAFSCVVTALVSYPHYLSYYSPFRLNVPKQEIAVNANLTWGQSIGELNTFFEQRHVTAPYVDTSMSTVDPRVYIPGARAWQCDKDVPVASGWVAVSADRVLLHAPGCSQLLRYPTLSVGDGSIFVFHVPG
jgi:Dolichyl-phosphate-mannose-protein mannosyltransferase